MSSPLTASAIVGTGPVFAADQDSGSLVYWVKNKLAFGTDGTRTDVTATAGLPVNQQTGSTWVVSAASWPLPAGASTAAKQAALGTAGTASADVLTVQGIASMTALKVDGSAVTQPVSGTFWQATQPISIAAALPAGGNTIGSVGIIGTVPVSGTFFQATQPVSGTVTANAGSGNFTVVNGGTFSTQATQAGTWNVTNISGTVSLPTGASTAAKQPALGTAGTASSDVISIQGIAGMTAVGVSGTVTANAGTNLNTSLLAIEAGGNLATLAGAVTSTKVQANVAQINGVTVTMGNGASGTGVQRVTLASDSTGQVTIAAGAASIGTVQPGNTPNTAAWLVSTRPATLGGTTPFSQISLASTNANNVKNSAGQIFGLYVTNTNASVRWLKFYNAATTPTAGSGTPVLRLMIPGNSSGFRIVEPQGIAFSAGIGFTITTGVADADTGAVAANEIVVNIEYA